MVLQWDDGDLDEAAAGGDGNGYWWLQWLLVLVGELGKRRGESLVWGKKVKDKWKDLTLFKGEVNGIK